MSKLLTLSVVALALAMALGLSSACDNPAVEVETLPGTIGEPEPVDLGTAPHRSRQRMDIAQLDASLRRATGGIGWMNGERNQFDTFAATLGVPDYVESTAEDRTISVLFLKFLDDAARSACGTLMTQEQEDGAERVFMVHADVEDTHLTNSAAIDENLAYLLLRFHGRYLSADSPELLPWRDVFETSMADTPGDEGTEPRETLPPEAWNAVCVGLITHPDFYTY